MAGRAPPPKPSQLTRRRLLKATAALPFAWAAASAHASGDTIEVIETRMEPGDPSDGGWLLSADFSFELGPRLEDAVNRGLTLYFEANFELTKARWYWFDEKTVIANQSLRLYYHAITRQYRVAYGALQRSFPSLQEAVAALSKIRGWRVIERGVVRPGEPYIAWVRLRLDTSQLPKPFQVNAITNREWTLGSDWKRFPFVATQELAR